MSRPLVIMTAQRHAEHLGCRGNDIVRMPLVLRQIALRDTSLLPTHQA